MAILNKTHTSERRGQSLVPRPRRRRAENRRNAAKPSGRSPKRDGTIMPPRNAREEIAHSRVRAVPPGGGGRVGVYRQPPADEAGAGRARPARLLHAPDGAVAGLEHVRAKPGDGERVPRGRGDVPRRVADDVEVPPNGTIGLLGALP